MSLIKGHLDNIFEQITKLIAVKDGEVAPLFARINELELQLRGAQPELVQAVADKEAAVRDLTDAQAKVQSLIADKGQLQADLDEAVARALELEKKLEAALVVPDQPPVPVPPVVVPVTPDPVVVPVVDTTPVAPVTPEPVVVPVDVTPSTTETPLGAPTV